MPEIVVGLVAGLLSALAYGSFAVPIKAEAIVSAKVHPLIFQSYKSSMCFLSAWIVLLWAEFRFTWWATVAAAIWVTNGVLAIISIHLAGLGVAQTMWSCVSVFVSFSWGKTVFNEPIANVPLSLTGKPSIYDTPTTVLRSQRHLRRLVVGLTLMVLGMLGLGWIASHFGASSHTRQAPKAVAVAVVDEVFADSLEPEETLEWRSGPQGMGGMASELQQLVAAADSSSSMVEVGASGGSDGLQKSKAGNPPDDNDMEDKVVEEASASGRPPEGRASPQALEPLWQRHKFALGVAGATLVGLLAGSMMVCLKLSPADRQGDQYTVSFGIGVAGVTAGALAAYAACCWLSGRNPTPFQFRVASGPACLAGILWSVGNYLSIVAVDRLGMAVGWPLVQCSLIVSNSWALLWYHEISDSRAVLYFFGCSVTILLGVFLLAWFGL